MWHMHHKHKMVRDTQTRKTEIIVSVNARVGTVGFKVAGVLHPSRRFGPGRACRVPKTAGKTGK